MWFVIFIGVVGSVNAGTTHAPTPTLNKYEPTTQSTTQFNTGRLNAASYNRANSKTDNADTVQHRIEDPPLNVLNKPRNTEPTTAVKNRDNVPTREELIAMGADNVDIVQHRIEDPPLNVLNKPRNTEPTTAVKNRDNVPTREELIAMGADNVDIVQHRIEDPPLNVLNKPRNTEPTTAVKNRDNVPTREELIAMGADNVDLVQLRVEDPPLNVLTKSGNKKPTTGVKNRDNVPTRDELIENGVRNVDFVQHRIDHFQPKRIVNDPIGSKAAHTNSKIFKNQTSKLRNKESLVILTTPLVSQDSASTTTENQPKPNEQIPVPKQTTQTILTTNELTSNGQSGTVKLIANSQISDKSNVVKSGATSSILTSREKGMGESEIMCPQEKCAVRCSYGYKVDANGCNTCGCKYSNSCPRAIPVSRLLCLLRVRTQVNQNCETDLDCRRNRICCPGTCGGSFCRRNSRNRSMLLSMLID